MGNEYSQLYKTIIGNFLEDIGIKAIDIEKGSHVLNAEVSRSETSSIILANMLESRRKMCEDLLDKFGLDIEVDLNVNYIQKILVEYTDIPDEDDDKEEDVNNG